MTKRIAINGFGRIGTLSLRTGLTLQSSGKLQNIEFAAINASATPKQLELLLKYDSVHGFLPFEVKSDDEHLIVDGHKIKLVAERDPALLPWQKLGIDLVIESTGAFNDGEKAKAHLSAGASKVVITAPAKNVDATIVLGVNHAIYDPDQHHIVSNASCTTNCLAPVAKVLDQSFGIKRGFLNTIHAYTNDQQLLDKKHKDLRRARAAALSMIPTTTGAAKAVALVLPQLTGKLDGLAVRVPVPDGSLIDLSVELEQAVTAEQINAAIKAASETPLSSDGLMGILEYTDDPIVSCDVVGNSHSVLFDSGLTQVLGENSNFAKVLAYYDNEWGYSCRVNELAELMLGTAA